MVCSCAPVAPLQSHETALQAWAPCKRRGHRQYLTAPPACSGNADALARPPCRRTAANHEWIRLGRWLRFHLSGTAAHGRSRGPRCHHFAIAAKIASLFARLQLRVQRQNSGVADGAALALEQWAQVSEEAGFPVNQGPVAVEGKPVKAGEVKHGPLSIRFAADRRN